MSHRDLLLKLMRLEYDLRGECELNDVIGASDWVAFSDEEVAELGRLKDEAFADWMTRQYPESDWSAADAVGANGTL